MKGREFVDAARTLAQSQRPCDLRSAVSRAYYGSYHTAILVLEESGVRFPSGSPVAHTKMPQCLENSNVPALQGVARRLRSLRDDRNRADYDMIDPQFENPNNASNCVRIAEHIVEAIDTLIAQPTEYEKLRVVLAHCARQLGLQVIT